MKEVIIGIKWLYSSESGSIWAIVAVFGQSCCIRAKVVVFGKKWLYWDKSGSIRSKDVAFGQKWF